MAYAGEPAPDFEMKASNAFGGRPEDAALLDPSTPPPVRAPEPRYDSQQAARCFESLHTQLEDLWPDRD